MRSRDRVAAVLAGEIPDRVPLAEWSVDHDTVSRVLGRPSFLRNKAACTQAFWEGRHAEVARSWRDDTIALHRLLPLDIVTFPMASWHVPEPENGVPPRRIDADTWEDDRGRVYRYTAAADDILCIRDPIAEAKVWTAADFPPDIGPAQPWNDLTRWVVDGIIDALGDEKYLAGSGGGEVGMVLPGGFERGCTLLGDDPELIDQAVTHRLACCERDDALIHPRMDACLWGADFGHKTGTFISPRAFRKHFKAANSRRVATLKQRGLRVLKHCCGNVKALLEDFVDMGYDAYQSIQGTAGMDINEIKASHGARLTLWGGVAVEHVVDGSPDQVRADVRRAMAVCKPGGRFILGTSHSIAVGSQWENFQALLGAWHQEAAYESCVVAQ